MTSPFVVTSESAIKALPVWLAALGVNTCSYGDTTRISVGRQRGRKYTYVASIHIRDQSLFDKALETVKLTIGN